MGGVVSYARCHRLVAEGRQAQSGALRRTPPSTLLVCAICVQELYVCRMGKCARRQLCVNG